MPAIEIGCRRLHRQVYEPEFFVDGDLCPYTRIAIRSPRIVQPGVVAKLSRPRDRIEAPKLLARTDIECANLPFGVVVRLDRHAFLHGHSDDHDILDDGWCRVQPRVARFQIDLLTASVNNSYLEIDDAVFSEPGNPVAGFGIQCN